MLSKSRHLFNKNFFYKKSLIHYVNNNGILKYFEKLMMRGQTKQNDSIAY